MDAIPTVYNHIQFRSRLEARWACMFDLIGWQYQYEPFDLEGYIPDFVLTNDPKSSVLAEVKPIVKLCDETVRRIESSSWKGPALILGCAIDFDLNFGWLSCARDGNGWDSVRFMMAKGDIYLTYHKPAFLDFITGKSRDVPESESEKEIRRIWAQAGNTVQWNANRPVKGR